MAQSRTSLQTLLESILGSGHVYFQPPDDGIMEFPCIKYERNDTRAFHADNAPYHWMDAYQVTHISSDPDSPVIDKLKGLPLSRLTRHFATSGLNHDVFVIYH